MRTKLILAAALPFLAIGVVATGYAVSRPSHNQLGDTLRSFGYLPLPLPTSKLGLGSLYYIDSNVRYFDVVCAARATDLDGEGIDVATGADLQMDVLTNGQFESSVKLDLTAKTVTKIWSYKATGNTYQTDVMGDIQRMPNGNHVIAFGGKGVIQEINPSGTVVQELRTQTNFGYIQKRATLYGPPPR